MVVCLVEVRMLLGMIEVEWMGVLKILWSMICFLCDGDV